MAVEVEVTPRDNEMQIRVLQLNHGSPRLIRPFLCAEKPYDIIAVQNISELEDDGTFVDLFVERGYQASFTQRKRILDDYDGSAFEDEVKRLGYEKLLETSYVRSSGHRPYTQNGTLVLWKKDVLSRVWTPGAKTFVVPFERQTVKNLKIRTFTVVTRFLHVKTRRHVVVSVVQLSPKYEHQRIDELTYLLRYIGPGIEAHYDYAVVMGDFGDGDTSIVCEGMHAHRFTSVYGRHNTPPSECAGGDHPILGGDFDLAKRGYIWTRFPKHEPMRYPFIKVADAPSTKGDLHLEATLTFSD